MSPSRKDKGLDRGAGNVDRVLLQEVRDGKPAPVYLFIGEFPITSEHVNALVSLLLPEGAGDMNLQELSGEDAVPGRCVEFLETRGFFPGRKVLLVKDPPFLHSSSTISARWKSAVAAIERQDFTKASRILSQLLGHFRLSVSEFLDLGKADLVANLKWPRELSAAPLIKFLKDEGRNITPSSRGSEKGASDMLIRWIRDRADPAVAVLVIQTEVADRRGAVYKAVKSCGRIVDLSVPSDKRMARRQAVNMVKQQLGSHGLSIEPRALDLLLDLSGQNNMPGLLQETEKLVSTAAFGKGTKKRITVSDVRRLVSHQREEELFRLTGAIASKDVTAALESLYLILDQGEHPLAVLGTLNNFLKKQLAISAAATSTVGVDTLKRVQFNQFKDRLLPELEAFFSDSDEQPFKGNPYALFMQCKGVGSIGIDRILDLLASMPEIDLELKGGASDPRLVLELLVMDMAGAVE